MNAKELGYRYYILGEGAIYYFDTLKRARNFLKNILRLKDENLWIQKLE